MRTRIARLALAGTLILTGAAGFACDEEDRPEVNDIEEGVEEGVDEVEDQIDEGSEENNEGDN